MQKWSYIVDCRLGIVDWIADYRCRFSENSIHSSRLVRADVTAHSATLAPYPKSHNSPRQPVPLPTAITIWRDFADVGVGMQLAPGALQ